MTEYASKALVTTAQKYQAISQYGRSEEVMSVFASLLGHEAPHYIQSALLAVKSNPALIECTPKSIFSAALRAATLQLSCDPTLGHAWIVPYKNSKTGQSEASFQAGWKGIQHLALRSGKYRYINVSPIFEGERVEEDRISGALRIEGDRVSDLQIGLIASFQLIGGFGKSIYMSNEEMEAHGKRYSKGYYKKDGIWQTNKPRAYHKTIVLQLLKTHGYLEPRAVALLEADEESGGLPELELPTEDRVTIIEDPKPKTKNEALRMMGFDAPEEEAEDGVFVEIDDEDPNVNTAPDMYSREKALMTIEDACKVTNENGEPYYKFTISILRTIIKRLEKSLRENHLGLEERIDQELKLEAAKLIIAAKEDGSLK